MEERCTNGKNRHQTRIAVYLLGMRNQSILLAKRKNTGHMDGYWSLVAGHVYEGESSTCAMIREALEECNITLTPQEITLIGAMHHSSPPYDYTNFIFLADLTHHTPTNLEPDKCETLEFHAIDNLPSPITPYVLEIIKRSRDNKPWVCEFGWDN